MLVRHCMTAARKFILDRGYPLGIALIIAGIIITLISFHFFLFNLVDCGIGIIILGFILLYEALKMHYGKSNISSIKQKEA